MPDIVIADSGRLIKNNLAVVFVTPVGSGTIKDRTYEPNRYIKPSGYGGNTTASILVDRFDDYTYYG